MERAYFVGFTSFTLGIGDYVPAAGPWQLATVCATISGLALTTAAITYLIPVVSAVTERSVQAATIAGLGSGPHGIVVNAYRGGSLRFLEPVFGQLAQELRRTAERQLSYPLLQYFHPGSSQTELRVQLASLDDALVLIEHGLGSEVVRPHPVAMASLRSAIAQLVERAVPAPASRPPPPLQLQPLREAGLPVVDETSFAERCERVVEHRARVAGYAAESKWPRPS